MDNIHATTACKMKRWSSFAHSIDGFHSIFSLGNWKGSHHHAACWLVNIHITWPFCPPVSVVKDAMEFIYSHVAFLPRIFWDQQAAVWRPRMLLAAYWCNWTNVPWPMYYNRVEFKVLSMWLLSLHDCINSPTSHTCKEQPDVLLLQVF